MNEWPHSNFQNLQDSSTNCNEQSVVHHQQQNQSPGVPHTDFNNYSPGPHPQNYSYFHQQYNQSLQGQSSSTSRINHRYQPYQNSYLNRYHQHHQSQNNQHQGPNSSFHTFQQFQAYYCQRQYFQNHHSYNSVIENYQYFQQYQLNQSQNYHQTSGYQNQVQSHPQFQQTPQQLSTLDGVQCGVPTLTTPTLTPTTLRNIQQTFLEASASQLEPPETHSNQAGFVPPVVHPQPGSTFISIDSKSLGGGIATLVDTSNLPSSESSLPTSIYSSSIPSSLTSSTSEPIFTQIGFTKSSSGTSTSTGGPPPLLPISDILTSSSSVVLPSESVLSVPGPATSPMPGLDMSNYSSDSDVSLDCPPTRRMGGRRPNNSEKLTGEEEHKRLMRRQRNKEAAARCRKRRLDQTNSLQEETEQLEESKAKLERTITELNQQKEELQFLLAIHKNECTRVVPRNKTPAVIVTSSNQPLSSANHVTIPLTHAVTSSEISLSSSHKSYHKMDDRLSEPYIKEEPIKEEDSETEEMEAPGNHLYAPLPGDRGQPVSSSLMVSSAALIPPMVPLTLTVSSSSSRSRPRPTSLAVAPLTELGVSIETPSSGLRGLNFDSMMEGGTGLTPVTPLTSSIAMATGLTPLTTPIMAHPGASVSTSATSTSSTVQCGYQQRSSSSELSSPDSISPKQLVSL